MFFVEDKFLGGPQDVEDVLIKTEESKGEW